MKNRGIDATPCNSDRWQETAEQATDRARLAVDGYSVGKFLRVIPPEAFTCYHCDGSADCEFAYDAYNLDGDCLASK